MAYCTPDDLVPYLGGALDPTRAGDACDAASDHVTFVCGQDFTDPVPAGVKIASVQAAVRFYRDPEAPFGVLGGLGETAAYARQPIPDLDHLLLGYRVSWGIA